MRVMRGAPGSHGASRLGIIAAGLLLAGGVAASDAASPEIPLSLEGAIGIALAANESLAAQRLALPTARAAVEQARERPNPDLTLETARETPRDALTLGLPIETAGKRRRRIQAAEGGALATEAELTARALELRGDVRRAFYALLAAQERAADAAELAQLAGRVREAAAARFAAGAAARLELLQMDLAQARTENEVLMTGAQVAAARIDLNLLLARSPERETVIVGDLAAGRVPGPEEATALALASSSELALVDRKIAEETARVALAQANQYPDPVVQASLTHRAEPEFDYGWRAGVTVTLPVFQHGAAAVRIEESQLARMQAERGAAVSRIRASVSSVAAVADARRRQVAAFREQILPRADEVERMAEDAYGSGQTSLVAMIQAVQSVRDVRAQAIQAGLDYQVALADLERGIGAPLP